MIGRREAAQQAVVEALIGLIAAERTAADRTISTRDLAAMVFPLVQRAVETVEARRQWMNAFVAGRLG